MTNEDQGASEAAVEEQLFSRLLSRIQDGICGRDNLDLINLDPRRTIFAGVLNPTIVTDDKGMQKMSTSKSANGGNSIGLDFRLKPSLAPRDITITLKPYFSLYYPVFPTFEQTKKETTEMDKGSPEEPPSQKVNTANSETEEEGYLPAEEEAEAQPLQQEAETAKELGDSKTVLPIVFRRINVVPEVITFILPPTEGKSISIGDEQLKDSLLKARSTIQHTTRLWRHLGNPKDHVRILGGRSVLESEKAFEAALQAVKGSPVSLPAWETTINVQVSSDMAQPDLIRVQIHLTNRTATAPFPHPEDPLLEQRCLFDTGFEVSLKNAVVFPFDFVLAPKDYRQKPQLVAKGINCCATYKDQPIPTVATDTVPVFNQPLYRTKDELKIRFDALAGADPFTSLGSISMEMNSFLKLWDEFLQTKAKDRFSPSELAACQADRNGFDDERRRFLLGIECLRKDKNLLKAFLWMNQVFEAMGNKRPRKVDAWRLFQICFIVSQLPSLAARQQTEKPDSDHERLVRETLNEVGILWFPTGGGKTEAYLGLIAVALLYDRLRGKSRGVTAWMRFPLRMLSLQQLERLAAVIAELNLLRDKEVTIQSGDPFAMGYYVGDRVAPNRILPDQGTLYRTSEQQRNKAKQLRKCPYCGSRVEMKFIESSWRLAHVCSSATCFSNTASSMGRFKGSLPICVVDNEIYRYLPSVLVGTVDKLAIVGRSDYFFLIMRGAVQECPTHGYTAYDVCVESPVTCKATKSKLKKISPILDPGPALLLQDEFHLLKAELGVFNGHYEGFLRYLGERVHLAPKVLAATATIESYDLHAFHIYLSEARRFPQPSWENGETFYATSHPLQYRRRYIGIACHTRAIEELAARITYLHQQEIRRLKADLDKALQEFGLKSDAKPMLMKVLPFYDLTVAYVTKKVHGTGLADKLEQADRSLENDGLGRLQHKLLTGDMTGEEVGAVLERIDKELLLESGERLDVLIATSLISHGVDLERINLMIMCGMPSHYAEYVQASSRSARSHPGLIVSCFRTSDPRERSQYELFQAMHENLERLIEPVAVNRFATFSADKTVPGLLAALLLAEFTPRLFGTKIAKSLKHIPTLLAALGISSSGSAGTQQCLTEAEIKEAIENILGVDKVRPPALASEINNLREHASDVLEDKLADLKRSPERYITPVLNPLTSFRDVDEGVNFGTKDSLDLQLRLSADNL